MNSYPPELTHHAYASMLVAGLVKPSSPPNLSRAASTSSYARSSRDARPETSPASSCAASIAPPTDGPAVSMANSTAPAAEPSSSTPSEQPAAAAAAAAAAAKVQAANAIALAPEPADLYPDLCKQLVDVFASRGKNTVWDPAHGRSAVFHSVLVDQNLRLPPRKTRPSPRSISSTEAASAALNTLPPRSPLSPLHPGSPLFPDGIVAPIWVRKHREIVPSVFVAFHCLVEPFVTETGTDAASDTQNAEQGVEADQAAPATSDDADGRKSVEANGTPTKRRALTGQELKARDEELIRLIADRKRTLVERGVKLTVVLLTTRDMLENPQLEARLSYIRRSSGLDSKASLFVLTPVPRSELGDFVTSLQGALYDHALDYYREHVRRVKRKSARYPPPAAVTQNVLEAVAASRPEGIKPPDLVALSREGWHVRAEYKLAMFAEFHGDYTTALFHYRNAYDLIAGPRGMLGSTMLLPPRTKRWAEAKVLSDTISIRIAKLHLYADDGSAALSQFQRHIGRFVELSSGWGIGDATFEFWSWLGKQYRLMGDLLEQATKAVPGSPLPPFQAAIHAPPLPGFLLHPDIADHPQSFPSLKAAPGALLSPNQVAMTSGARSSGLLQGPGAFHYLAALCAEERRIRFQKMLALEEKGEVSESGAAALVHEKKLDHAGQIIEAYGRAHEIFKTANQQRLSLAVASKIALAYVASGQQKMALRFLERILKSYKREQWSIPVLRLLAVALDCAMQTGEPESAFQLLLETASVSDSFGPDGKELIQKAWQKLRDCIQDREGIERPPVSLTFEAPHDPFSASVVFRHQSIGYGTTAPFQLTLRQSAHSIDTQLDELALLDDRGAQAAVLRHSDGTELLGQGEVAFADLGLLTGSTLDTSLQWAPGSSRTFQASMKPRHRESLRISCVVLTFSSPVKGEMRINIPQGQSLQLPQAPNWLTSVARQRWIQLAHREDATICHVNRPAHKVEVNLRHHPIGYLDEAMRIVVQVKNNDHEELACSADVVLQPAFSVSQDELGFEGQQPTLSGNLKGLSFNTIAPGEQAAVAFTLRGRLRTGPRSMSVFVQTVPASPLLDAGLADLDTSQLASETVRDANIGIQRAFRAEYSANWRSAESQLGSSEAEGQLPVSPAGSDLLIAGSGGFEDMPRSPSSKAERHAVADLHAAFGVLTQDSVRIEDVHISIDEECRGDAQVIEDFPGSEEREALRKTMLDGLWREGDRWGFSWDVRVALQAYQLEEGPRGPTGHLVIHWKRDAPSPKIQAQEEEAEQADLLSCLPVNTTRLPLPILAPPHLNARVLVAAPPVTHVLHAFTLVFVVVNPSPHAVDASVFIDDSPAWAVAHRTLSIPGIPARGSRSVPTRIVPRTEGTWVLPRVRAFQQRTKEEMESGLLLNETQYGLPLHVRFRASAGATLGAAASRAVANGHVPSEQEGPSLSVLVLPREDASTA